LLIKRALYNFSAASGTRAGCFCFMLQAQPALVVFVFLLEVGLVLDFLLFPLSLLPDWGHQELAADRGRRLFLEHQHSAVVELVVLLVECLVELLVELLVGMVGIALVVGWVELGFSILIEARATDTTIPPFAAVLRLAVRIPAVRIPAVRMPAAARIVRTTG